MFLNAVVYGLLVVGMLSPLCVALLSELRARRNFHLDMLSWPVVRVFVAAFVVSLTGAIICGKHFHDHFVVGQNLAVQIGFVLLAAVSTICAAVWLHVSLNKPGKLSASGRIYEPLYVDDLQSQTHLIARRRVGRRRGHRARGSIIT